MALNSNSNYKFIRRLALKSLKENPFRNTCVIITIIISTILMILLPVFNSTTFFYDFEDVDKQQQAIYYEVTDEQIQNLKQDDQLSDTVLNKIGSILQYDDSYLRLSYYEDSQKDTHLFTLNEGNFPNTYNEVMIDQNYAQEKNLSLGDAITVLDASSQKETFVISGILESTALDSSIPVLCTSEEYAENGTLLKDLPYNMYIKTESNLSLNQDDNIDLILNIGEEYGIDVNDIEINAMYMGSNLFSPERLYFYFFVDFALLIVGLIVIYSILYISVLSLKSFFAQLNTLGMSRVQIKKFIRQESLVLSVTGTMIGSILAGIISYLAVSKYWDFSFYLLTSIVVSFFVILTIVMASSKPAKIASSISPIEATKNIDQTKGINSKIHKMCPEVLSQMHFYKDIKKSIFTMISLVISGIVFFVSISYTYSVSDDTYARSGYFRQHEYMIQFINTQDYTNQNLIALQRLHLYDDELIQKLEAVPGVESVDKVKESYTTMEFNGDQIYTEINPINKKQYENVKKYIDHPLTYEELVEKQGIIETRNQANEDVYGWKFEMNDKVPLNFFTGTDYIQFTASIQGLTSEDFLAENYTMYGILIPEEVIQKVYPGIDLTRYLLIDIDEQQYSDETDQQINEILEDYPLLTSQSWKEQKTEMARQNDIVKLLSYIVSAFCIFFCIINTANTLISSMLSRVKELALYESIGMERKQIKKMLVYETIYMCIPAIMLSLVIGIITGKFFIHLLSINEMKSIAYQLPIIWVIAYIAFMIIIPISIVLREYHKFSKIPLVDRLKEDE